MEHIDPTHLARIEKALKAVLDFKQRDPDEARHRPHYVAVAGCDKRRACLARIVAEMLRADRKTVNRPTPASSPEDLGAWIFSNWGDIREKTVIAATCGAES